jgi:hypothetical protein
MYREISVIVLLATALTSCTSIQVQPVERSLDLKHVCIQENPNAEVDDFLPVVRDGFDRHGISTKVYKGDLPELCDFILTYISKETWDFGRYLHHAELRLERNGRKVAYAEYHLIGKGGLSLMKWESTKTKMDPVLNEMLNAY